MAARRPAKKRKRVARRRGGRPSRADAAQLGETILDIATQLFLNEGYGATSIEAIARRARMAKRTFYARFPDKEALFSAVVHRVVARLRPSGGVEAFDGGTIDAILTRLARYILDAALSAEALALHRLILAEATRFPALARVLIEEGGSREGVAAIAAFLAREVAAGRLAVANPAFAAAQFLQMVVALPQRRALGLGTPMTVPELHDWARETVTLFLDGCRTRQR